MTVTYDVQPDLGLDEVLYVDESSIRVTARRLGERIDVRELSRVESILPAPVMQRVGERGYAVVFRYGTVVFFETEEDERTSFEEVIGPFVSGVGGALETEEALVLIEADGEETLHRQSESRLFDPSAIVLRSASHGRLQMVAEVVGKSVALGSCEKKVSGVFDRIEPFAMRMQNGHPSHGGGQELLQLLGDAAVTQTQTIGRVEIRDKPDIAWDRRDLDGLYQRLSAEYGLRERDALLTRKLQLVSTTTSTFFSLQQNQHTLRVEWYIVTLILVEIVLILYDIFLTG